MKVALVLCPAWSREVPHLAIAILSACLRRNGHEVFVFDLNNDFYHNCIEKYKTKWRKEEDLFWTENSFVSGFISEHEHIIRKAVKNILATDAQVIGFSVYFPTELMSLELARRIKEIDSQRVIVFGGFQCLREIKGKEFINDSSVDIVVMGEGEQTIIELTETIESKGVIDFCEGVMLKRNGCIIDCGNRAPITELNSLPFPDFRDFSPYLYEKSNAFPLLSSRGCFQDCVYCTVNIFWDKYRSTNAERMLMEIKLQLKRFNCIDTFIFYDPLLNGNIKELSRFCDFINDEVDKGIIHPIKWTGQAIIRPEMTRRLLRKMRKAGCWGLSYGIESGSQNVLDKMRKHFKISDAESVIRYTHRAGIKVSLNFMFGFPYETEEFFQETLDFIKRNRQYIDFVLPSESFCYIDKGTYLYEHAEEFGVLPNPHTSFWESIDGKNNYTERLKRFRIFCELACSLGIAIGMSRDKVKIFEQQTLAKYFAYKDTVKDKN